MPYIWVMRALVLVAALFFSAASLAQRVLILGPTDTGEATLLTHLQARYQVERGPDEIDGYTIPSGVQVIIDTDEFRSNVEEFKLLQFIQNGGTYISRYRHDQDLMTAQPADSASSDSSIILNLLTTNPTLNAGLPQSFPIPTDFYPVVLSTELKPGSIAFYGYTSGGVNYVFAASRQTGAGRFIFLPHGDNGWVTDLSTPEMRAMIYNVIDWSSTVRRSGVIIENPTTGAIRIHYVNTSTGNNAGWATLSPNMALNRTVNLLTDLNRDGWGDLVVRDTSSLILEYNFYGFVFRGSVAPLQQRNNTFTLLGNFDVNGDGHRDYLYHNTGLQVISADLHQGGRFIGSQALFNARAGFAPIIFSDFDRDGHQDILWQDLATGALSWWKLVNGQYNPANGTNNITGTVPTHTLVTAGDLNNDGRADLAFYNSATGQITIWFLDAAGTAATTVRTHAALPAGFRMTRGAGIWQ